MSWTSKLPLSLRRSLREGELLAASGGCLAAAVGKKLCAAGMAAAGLVPYAGPVLTLPFWAGREAWTWWHSQARRMLRAAQEDLQALELELWRRKGVL